MAALKFMGKLLFVATYDNLYVAQMSSSNPPKLNSQRFVTHRLVPPISELFYTWIKLLRKLRTAPFKLVFCITPVVKD